MVTNKSSGSRSGSTSASSSSGGSMDATTTGSGSMQTSATGSSGGNTQGRSWNAGSDETIVARAQRTIKERPFATAAVAAVAAGGAFLLTRKDKTFMEASADLTSRVRGGFTSAGQRGTGFFRGGGTGETRSQQDIAQEAFALKQGETASGLGDSQSSTEIEAGAIAYGA